MKNTVFLLLAIFLWSGLYGQDSESRTFKVIIESFSIGTTHNYDGSVFVRPGQPFTADSIFVNDKLLDDLGHEYIIKSVSAISSTRASVSVDYVTTRAFPIPGGGYLIDPQADVYLTSFIESGSEFLPSGIQARWLLNNILILDSLVATKTNIGGSGGSGPSYAKQSVEPTDSTMVWVLPITVMHLDKIHVYNGGGYTHVGWRNTLTGAVGTRLKVFLSTGQSNAREHPNRTGGDLLSDIRIMHWDTEDDPSGLWTQADVGVNNSIPFQLAKNMVKNDPDVLVYYISIAATGRLVNSWTADGEMITNIKTAMAANGVTDVDFILWDQGEANSTTDSIVYAGLFDTVLDTFRNQPWYNDTRPFLAVGMGTWDGACGPNTQEYYRSFSNNSDPFTGFVDTDGIWHADFDSCHFSGEGTDSIGVRAYTTLLNLPYDPNRVGQSGNGSLADGDYGDFTKTGDDFQINNATIVSDDIANSTIKASNMAINSVGISQIAANSVGSSELVSSGVVAGSYTNVDLTVNEDGIITLISNGSSGGGSAPTLYGDSDNTITFNFTPTASVFILRENVTSGTKIMRMNTGSLSDGAIMYVQNEGAGNIQLDCISGDFKTIGSGTTGTLDISAGTAMFIYDDADNIWVRQR